MKICERGLPTGVVCGEPIPCPHHDEEFASPVPEEASVVMLNDRPFAVVLGGSDKALTEARAAAEAYVRKNGWALPDDPRTAGELRSVVFVHTKPVAVYR